MGQGGQHSLSHQLPRSEVLRDLAGFEYLPGLASNKKKPDSQSRAFHYKPLTLFCPHEIRIPLPELRLGCLPGYQLPYAGVFSDQPLCDHIGA